MLKKVLTILFGFLVPAVAFAHETNPFVLSPKTIDFGPKNEVQTVQLVVPESTSWGTAYSTLTPGWAGDGFSITPAFGAGQKNITLYVSRTGKTPGTYRGELTIFLTDDPHQKQNVEIAFSVPDADLKTGLIAAPIVPQEPEATAIKSVEPSAPAIIAPDAKTESVKIKVPSENSAPVVTQPKKPAEQKANAPSPESKIPLRRSVGWIILTAVVLLILYRTLNKPPSSPPTGGSFIPPPPPPPPAPPATPRPMMSPPPPPPPSTFPPPWTPPTPPAPPTPPPLPPAPPTFPSAPSIPPPPPARTF